MERDVLSRPEQRQPAEKSVRVRGGGTNSSRRLAQARLLDQLSSISWDNLL